MEEAEEQVFEGKLVERAVQEQDDTGDGVIENDAANGENWSGPNVATVRAVAEEGEQE